jgi:hypothetical protein
MQTVFSVGSALSLYNEDPRAAELQELWESLDTAL